ncbi:MAG: hypothetical protein EBS07_11375, partial [Sphingobacteriia bacterium]|nr:hypothetical protein [Sphingobacteriia bacterium]
MRNFKKYNTGFVGVFLLLSVVFGYGQGGTDCATAIGLPLALPFTGTNLTNCGSLDDYTAANSVPCGNNLYLGGEDHVYVFQTPTAGPVQITLSSLSTSVGIFLYDNCPDVPGTNCVGNSTTFSGNQQINFTATAGGTYFLTVDSWPGVTCHPAYDLYIGPPLPPNNQDCLGAIPLCQPTYNQPNSFSGEGNVINEIDNTTSCLGSGELNDVWYTFTVQNSGILNFSITPNQLTDDYDWAVYDLTNHNCSDIFTTPALEVSCNFSGNPGITGANGNIAQPQNMPTIPVVAGQVFVLNISNFSSTQFGYTLDFTQSTASIFDQIPPRIDSILGTPLACGRDSIIVRMSENVVCSSVQPADFVLHGPGGPYIVNSVVSQGCTSGSNYDNIYQLSFSPPISGTGSFYMVLQGVVQDVCLNNSVVDSLRINIPPYTPFASENRQICLGDTVHLWATGATGYTWTPSNGLSNPNIANPVFTDTVTRTYVVQMAIPCPAIFILDTVTITVLSRPTVEAGPDTFLCQGSGGVQLNAVASGGIPPYTYVWSPNGGPISNFNITNPVANPLQDTTFYFYATGFNGCRSNLDSLRVSVVPLPLVDAGFDLSFCKDAPGVFLQGQIINPIGSYRVRWLPQTGLFCDTCLVTYAQPNQTTIYTLRVTELATGCSSD